MSKIFIDTNILAYCLDRHDLEKQNACRNLLRELGASKKGVLSTQVLQEFYVVATRKLGADPLTTKEILRSFERFEIVTITPQMIMDAIDCGIIHRLSFWDALIVTAAETAGCQSLWTEDLNDGQVIRGVRVRHVLK